MTNFYIADSNNAIIRITVSSCLLFLFFAFHFSLKCDFAAKLSFFPISSYKL